jgi:hypothetical protein
MLVVPAAGPVTPVAADAPVTVVQEPTEVIARPAISLLLHRASPRNMRTATALSVILSRTYLEMGRVIRQARRPFIPGSLGYQVLPGLDITEFHSVQLRTMAGRLAFYVSSPGLEVADPPSSDDEGSSAVSEFSIDSVRASLDFSSDNVEDMS